MPLVKRQPRKKIRASKAAAMFSITTETFVKHCREGIYPISLLPGPKRNSPLMCFQAQVEAEAVKQGIL